MSTKSGTKPAPKKIVILKMPKAKPVVKKATRVTKPAPVVKVDPNAGFLDLVKRYNEAEMTRHNLLAEVVTATMKRHGDQIRLGKGGLLLHQTINNPGPGDAGSDPHILVIENLGTP